MIGLLMHVLIHFIFHYLARFYVYPKPLCRQFSIGYYIIDNFLFTGRVFKGMVGVLNIYRYRESTG